MHFNGPKSFQSRINKAILLHSSSWVNYIRIFPLRRPALRHQQLWLTLAQISRTPYARLAWATCRKPQSSSFSFRSLFEMRSLLVSSASHSARPALRTKVSFDSSSVPFVSCSSCLCFLRDLLWSISQSSCSLHGQGPHELAYLSLALVPWICLPLRSWLWTVT